MTVATFAFLLWTATVQAFSALPAKAQVPSSSAQKPFGALILVPADGGKNWATAAASLKKELSRDFPVEMAAATDDKVIQKAVRRLETRKTRKIVVVPIVLSSHGIVMDHVRYLLGIRKEPSRDYLSWAHAPDTRAPVKRIKSAVPVVLTQGLDDHPLIAEILASRAKELSREPAAESLLFVGVGAKADRENSQWVGMVGALADRARRLGGFRSSRLFILPDQQGAERNASSRQLRELALGLLRQGPVIVLPLFVAFRGDEPKIRRILDGVMVKYNGKALLPDRRINQWVAAQAAAGALLPDMRTFRKEERVPAAAAAKSRLPSISTGGKP